MTESSFYIQILVDHIFENVPYVLNEFYNYILKQLVMLRRDV